MTRYIAKKLPKYTVKIKADMSITYSGIEIPHLQFLAKKLNIDIPTLLGDVKKHEKAIEEIGGYDDVKVKSVQVIVRK